MRARLVVVLLLLTVAGSARGQDLLDELLRRLDRGPRAAREQAIGQIAALGSAAEAAVPALVARLEDEEVRADAASALRRLGPRGLSGLRETALGHRRPRVRALALAALPCDTPEVLAVHVQVATSDEDPEVRAQAVLGLAEAPATPEVVAAVERAAQPDQPDYLRREAVTTLRLLGRRSGEARAALVALVRLSTIGRDAARALALVGPLEPALLDELVALLGHDERRCRETAEAALQAVGRRCLPAVRVGLRDPRERVRIGSLPVLAWFAGDDAALGEEHMRATEDALADPAAGVREAAGREVIHWYDLCRFRTGSKEERVHAPPSDALLASLVRNGDGDADDEVRGVSRQAFSACVGDLRIHGTTPGPSVFARVYAARGALLTVSVLAWFLLAHRVRSRMTSRARRAAWTAAVVLVPAIVTCVLVHSALARPWVSAFLSVPPGTLVPLPVAGAATAVFLVLLVALWTVRRPGPG